MLFTISPKIKNNQLEGGKLITNSVSPVVFIIATHNKESDILTLKELVR